LHDTFSEALLYWLYDESLAAPLVTSYGIRMTFSQAETAKSLAAHTPQGFSAARCGGSPDATMLECWSSCHRD
jgi:hypothetical protein